MALGKRLINTGVIAADAACSTDSVQAFGAESAFSSNIALYQLDGNDDDTTGNFSGTSDPNVTYSATGAKFGQAANFNGSSSYIDVSSFSFGSDNLSISMWIKPSSTQNAYANLIDFNQTDTSKIGVFAIQQDASNTNQYQIWQYNGSSYNQSNSVTLTADTWNHLVYALQSNGNYALYLNGTSSTSGSNLTASTSGVTETLNIGRWFNDGGTAGRYFNGSIDQIRMFNKALSAEDVATLYAETTSTASDTNPLSEGSGVALYSLDYDASDAGGNYDGTPDSAVEFGVAGVTNYGARFSSTTTGIVNTSLQLNSTAHSISLWVKPAEVVSGRWNTIFMSYFLGHPAGFLGKRSDQSTYFHYRTESGSELYFTLANADTWYHIVITRDSGGVDIYVDGSFVTSNSDSMGTYSSSAYEKTVIGSNPIYTGEYFNGSIDQVRLFSKALSSDEVDTLYNNGDGETACVYTATANTADFPSDATAVAHYPLDNNSLDNKGTNDGTDTNIEYRFGRFGQAAVFNGSSSYIESSISTNILNSDYTISFWGNSSNGSGNQTFINTGNGSSTAFVRIDYSASGNLNFFHRNSASTTYNDVSIVSGMADGNWHHIVITKDDANVKVYKDGDLESTITSTSGTYSNPTTLQIGRNNYNTNGVNNFDGSIDQVRIYSTALDSDQVADLYNEKPEVDTSNFKAVLWDGTSAENYISQVGMDLETSGGLVWIKQRSSIATDHRLFDSVRGVTQILASSNTNAQGSNSETLKSFEANGFVLGTNTAVNDTGDNFVAWVWKGGGDAVSTNNNGGAQITADVSANTEAGFSIVKYSGNGTLDQTVYHGLDEAPEIVITKLIGGTEDWFIFTTAIDGSHDYLIFDTDAKANSSITAPTTDYIHSRQSGTIINYCFHSVAGYSKIGRYDGGTNGIQLPTGFKASWIMIKKYSSGTGRIWYIYDTVRGGDSEVALYADLNNEESSSSEFIDFNDTNIQINATGDGVNGSGSSYLYMAFK